MTIMKAMRSKPQKESGFVLIASMFMLIILTVLAVSLYRNFTVQESVAANTKEKGRAFQMAQSTLQFGEYSLLHNLSAFQQSDCETAATPPQQLRICSITPFNIANPTSGKPAMSLVNATQYQPPSIVLSKTGGNSTDNNGLGYYYDYPQLYVQYLGISADGQGNIYQVTALAYGGNVNATAVVQSTYEVTTGVKNLGGL